MRRPPARASHRRNRARGLIICAVHRGSLAHQSQTFMTRPKAARNFAISSRVPIETRT